MLLVNSAVMAAPAAIVPQPASNAEASVLLQKQQEDTHQSGTNYKIMQESGLRNPSLDATGNRFPQQEGKDKYNTTISSLPSMQEVNHTAHEAIEICENRRRSGTLKTRSSTVKCSNSRIIAAFEMAEYPYMDIIRQYTGKRLLIARKQDKNQITEPEAAKELEAFTRHIEAEEQGRGVSTLSY